MLSVVEGLLDAFDADEPRPDFCLLPIWVCRAAGGDADQAIRPAGAWHLLHVAAMLLDDVEDNELGLKDWPPMTAGQAVNIVTTFIFLSQLMLARPDRAGMTPLRALALQETYSRAALKTCVGQHRDLDTDFANLDDHWQTVAAKSGESFSLACRVAAMLASDDPHAVEAYAKYGLNLGMLVQIGDDIRGVWHPLGPIDLLHGNKTLPVSYALSVGDETMSAHLREVLKRASNDLCWAMEARRILSEVGAIEYLFAEAEVRRGQALRALPETEDSEAQAHLLSILDQVSPRLDLGDGGLC